MLKCVLYGLLKYFQIRKTEKYSEIPVPFVRKNPVFSQGLGLECGHESESMGHIDNIFYFYHLDWT